MNLKGITYQVSETEKDKYCIILFIHGIQKQTNKQTYRKRDQILVNRGREQMEGELKDGSQNLQTPSYKINKY